MLIAAIVTGCGRKEDADSMTTGTRILFLHHSTGQNIWNGGVPEWFTQYNQKNGTDYHITDLIFPKSFPYGWNNFPYDYWNIWVNHAGESAYVAPAPGLKNGLKTIKQLVTGEDRGEPTLELLARDYDVIVMKHCFPGAAITSDTGAADISSPVKSLENYRLQYAAIKDKMREFPQTTFIVWTSAALVEEATTLTEAERTREFVRWVTTEWDEPGDNIFLWDFYTIETEGGLYLKQEFAAGAGDSHPNAEFSRRAAPMFAQRIVDVLEGRGDTASITGE